MSCEGEGERGSVSEFFILFKVIEIYLGEDFGGLVKMEIGKGLSLIYSYMLLGGAKKYRKKILIYKLVQ